MGDVVYTTSNTAVLILFFCLLCLFFLLIFLYKKLNKETDGEYTVTKMCCKDGGIGDQVRGAALALGTRFGDQLRHGRNTDDEDGEEMQEIRDEERKVEKGSSQESDSEGEDQEEQHDNAETSSKTKGDDASDNSSLEGSGSGEQARLMDQPEAVGETEEKMEEKKGKMGEGAGKGEASATWAEEEGKDRDVTAL